MHPDKQRDPILQQAEENLLNAKVNVKQIAELVQTNCPHTLVYQTDFAYRSSPRICPKCGLEVDSHSIALGTSTWTAKDFVKSPLNNHEDRVVMMINEYDFLNLRVKG